MKIEVVVVPNRFGVCVGGIGTLTVNECAVCIPIKVAINAHILLLLLYDDLVNCMIPMFMYRTEKLDNTV